jgi:hypothetical protein
LAIGCCILAVGCCLLAVGYCLLSIDCCLLSVACWLLKSTSRSAVAVPACLLYTAAQPPCGRRNTRGGAFGFH